MNPNLQSLLSLLPCYLLFQAGPASLAWLAILLFYVACILILLYSSGVIGPKDDSDNSGRGPHG